MHRLAALLLLVSTLGACRVYTPGTSAVPPELAGTWVGRQGTSGGGYREWKLVIAPENWGGHGERPRAGSGEVANAGGRPCPITFVARYDRIGSPPLAIVATGTAGECADRTYVFYGKLIDNSRLVTQLQEGDGTTYAYVNFVRKDGA